MVRPTPSSVSPGVAAERPCPVSRYIKRLVELKASSDPPQRGEATRCGPTTPELVILSAGPKHYTSGRPPDRWEAGRALRLAAPLSACRGRQNQTRCVSGTRQDQLCLPPPAALPATCGAIGAETRRHSEKERTPCPRAENNPGSSTRKLKGSQVKGEDSIQGQQWPSVGFKSIVQDLGF